MTERTRERLLLLIQFAVSVAWGWAFFVWTRPEAQSDREAYIGALIVGFVGMRATFFAYVWLRWGWRAARSMRMDFN